MQQPPPAQTMRFTLTLCLALIACGGTTPSPAPADAPADTPAVDATPEAAVPCGGLCGAGTVCEGGRCVTVMDGAAEDVGVDAAAEAAVEAAVMEATVDVPPDGESRCTPSTLTYCGMEPVSPGCWNLDTSNGQIPARNCGACGRACPPVAPECVGGRCSEARDAGADASDGGCATGFADCDGEASNGCETSITTVVNCGGCGRACPGGGGYRCCPMSTMNLCPRETERCGP